MGIDLPPEPPELIPGNNYFAHWQAYLGGCGTPLVVEGGSVHTGAEIDAWFAAGNQCKVGSPIIWFPGIDTQYIDSITPVA